MFPAWRIQLREAEQAFEQGRLEDAGRLVLEADLQHYLPGRKLADKVAGALADRAGRLALAGEWTKAWKDLERARWFGGDSRQYLEARRALTSAAREDVERHLRGGDTAGALGLLAEVDRRGGLEDGLKMLRDVARRLESARNLSLRGRFREAGEQLEAAEALRPDLEVVRQRREEYRRLGTRSREIQQRLHQALAQRSWNDALAAADRLLELAPHSRLARNARKRAWSEVGADAVDSGWSGQRRSSWTARSAADATAVCDAPGVQAPDSVGSRFLLWVDAVGGILVCLNDEVVLGQAVPGTSVDIPVLADISRRHAAIRRCGDGYTIEPWSDVRVAGKPIGERTLLSDGDEIELSGSVRLRFRQTHALSASARLEFLSRHRTQPSADFILLMAESCVLGPSRQNHVVCRDWTADVVLFRQEDELYCRSMEAIEIDGQLYDGKGRVTRNARIAGDDFAMGLEAV